MTIFLFGLILFLGIHCVSIVAPRWRMQQVAVRGEGAWKGIYSVVAAIGLAALIYGYGIARHDGIVLYQPPTFLRHIALLLMVPVFPLLIAAYLPGRISRIAKHPMLLAVKFWATAHLLANGSLADVLLFGGFLAWAVIDRISLKRRAPEVSHGAPGAPAKPFNDVLVVIGGLIVYVAFLLFLHRWLIGVSPLASMRTSG